MAHLPLIFIIFPPSLKRIDVSVAADGKLGQTLQTGVMNAQQLVTLSAAHARIAVGDYDRGV